MAVCPSAYYSHVPNSDVFQCARTKPLSTIVRGARLKLFGNVWRKEARLYPLRRMLFNTLDEPEDVRVAIRGRLGQGMQYRRQSTWITNALKDALDLRRAEHFGLGDLYLRGTGPEPRFSPNEHLQENEGKVWNASIRRCVTVEAKERNRRRPRRRRRRRPTEQT